MVVIGAKGHAKEIFGLLQEKGGIDDLHFFDNVTETDDREFLNFPLVKSLDDLERIFSIDPRFILGLGGTKRRQDLANRLRKVGGELSSIISSSAGISKSSRIGVGVNIMPLSAILGDAVVEEGVLVHSCASIHHDSYVGKYSEISPGARILGYCKIGSACSIGSNAVILPGITITDNVTIGAGSVVTKDIDLEGVYVGAPIKKIN